MDQEITKVTKRIQVLEIALKVLYVLFFPALLMYNFGGLLVMVSLIFGLYMRLKYTKKELEILVPRNEGK